MFVDILRALRDLKRLSQGPELDGAGVYCNLVVLKTRFDDLTTTAQILSEKLEQRTDFPEPNIRRLIDYAERFLGELIISADGIGETVRDIGETELGRLLQAAAEHAVRDSLEATPDNVAVVRGQWRRHWELFCAWFISDAERTSSAELLRKQITASIPILLRVITNINDRQMYRVSRSDDFRVLARWFAQSTSDAEAHRLWRAVFGLCPALRLSGISIRTRDDSSNSQPVLSRIVDRTAEKEKLAAAIHEESLRILTSQARFAGGRQTRLSQLECLEPGEFDVFVDLLAEALSARVLPTEPVEVLSSDGCLRLKLEPTGDGRKASIATPEGVFSGPDHWISLEQS